MYVAPSHARRGVGRSLLAALIQQSEDRGYWTLQAGVFPENVASLALHRALGFEALGLRRRIGRMSSRTDGRTVARRAVPGTAQPARRRRLAARTASLPPPPTVILAILSRL
jgi:ribosomal protein S18 acetylase RimI-like enzyme